MPPAVTDENGHVYKEGHPDYDRVRIANLERQLRELTTAVGDLQHRLSRVDSEPLQWPGDTYEPVHTRP